MQRMSAGVVVGRAALVRLKGVVMNWYDGLRYRVEATDAHWAGPWESIHAAMGQMGRMVLGGYIVVDERGMTIASKRHGLLIPVSDFQQRKGARSCN